MVRWSDATAYRNALPEERWGKGMSTLGAVLRREAAGNGGRFVGYVLPAGVCVAMRVLPTGARELRVSRQAVLDMAAEEGKVKRESLCTWARPKSVIQS